MLSHAMQSSRPIELSNSEHQAIALVFENQSGRIRVSPNHAAIPGGRDDGGAVKRDLPRFRVLSFSVHLLLIVCLLLLLPVLPSAGQSGPDENKPKDEAKREELKEAKKEDLPKHRPGTPSTPAGTIHFNAHLPPLSLTLTDPYNH